ncbi:MAG: TIGR03085 family metal-binding protein [Nocardioides sp.]
MTPSLPGSRRLLGRGPSLARRERDALCDTALAVGEAAPTLCGDWTAKQLVEHLLVRERDPLGAAGIVVPALAGLTDAAMARTGRRDFAVLVERLRRPGLTPYALPGLEEALNTVEYVVHHEDLLRAQPDWSPRTLAPGDLDAVWRGARVAGRGLVRPAGVPVRAVRSDTGASTTLRRGDDPVVVTGPPVEVLLFLFGRDRLRDLELTGPPDRVAALRRAPRSA